MYVLETVHQSAQECNCNAERWKGSGCKRLCFKCSTNYWSFMLFVAKLACQQYMPTLF